LKKLSKDYHKELEKLQKDIWKMAGEEFNVNSPRQLGTILFEKMGLKVKGQKKTAGGAMSTRESELEKMRELHPIIEQILHYRELQKLLSTYIDTIPNMIASDERVAHSLCSDRRSHWPDGFEGSKSSKHSYQI
jgi:DNA polymerase-1